VGLLDDAIRDHLELKRRRGADPGEIARQEREALGPARRGAETAAPTIEDARPPTEPAATARWEEEAPSAPATDFEELEAEFGEEPEEEDDGFADEQAGSLEEVATESLEPDSGEPTSSAPPPPQPGADTPAPSPPQPGADTPAPSPPEPRAPTPAAATPDAAQPTTEYDVLEGERGPAGPAPEEAERRGLASEEADDLLEDTPEFLQETPEHDRLWFEQRPPRDFDFDG
jgi:hypothetical protein